jgi:hypothetical protein
MDLFFNSASIKESIIRISFFIFWKRKIQFNFKKSRFEVNCAIRNFVFMSLNFLLLKKNNGVADQNNNSADHFTNSQKRAWRMFGSVAPCFFLAQISN